MVIDERCMIVRLQRWLTTRRQRPRQAHEGPATARLPALIAEAADGDQRPSGNWPRSLCRSSTTTVVSTSGRPRPLSR